MIYTLMHKNIKVIDLDFNSEGHIKKLGTIYNIDHIPYGLYDKIKHSGKKAFIEWFENRSIPLSRNDIDNLKAQSNNNINSLVLKCNAVSLSDQYWLKEANKDIFWEEINFFDNPFSMDIGDVLVGKQTTKPTSFASPDISSNGNLVKRWKIINGKRVLLKSGSKPYNYEVFGEIMSSKIMDILNIEHVNYYFLKDDNKIYSCSEDFVDFNHDLISIFQIYNSEIKSNDESLFEYINHLLEKLNVPNYKDSINKMLFIDYLVGNTDRHLNNFGVLRNVKTLEFEKMAPIYDTGSCLGFDMTDNQLKNATKVEWKPFKSKTVGDQLELIDDYSWLDTNSLKLIIPTIKTICESFKEYISEQRMEAIISFVDSRINTIKEKLNISDIPLSQLDNKILAYIKENKQLDKIDDLVVLFNKSHITIQRSINKLVKLNIIIRVGANKNGYWKIK